MAFGGVMVDETGIVTRFPGRSMLTGLLANALGWDQAEAAAHQTLQQRIRFAARLDRPGQPLVDFHTVDLGQPHLRAAGWTTRGVPEGRDGGPAKTGTHIRRRHYRSDARVTVALTLDPPDSHPTVDDLAEAVREPARPLFLGRKTCLPSAPIHAGLVDEPRLVDALARHAWACIPPARRPRDLPACCPIDEFLADSRTVTMCDDRDWSNQVHTGQRVMFEGRLILGGAP